jgi:hypothetical protein
VCAFDEWPLVGFILSTSKIVARGHSKEIIAEATGQRAAEKAAVTRINYPIPSWLSRNTLYNELNYY